MFSLRLDFLSPACKPYSWRLSFLPWLSLCWSSQGGAGAQHTGDTFLSQRFLWSLSCIPKWLQTPLVSGTPTKDVCLSLLFRTWTLSLKLSTLHSMLPQFLGLLESSVRWQLSWVVP